MTLTTEQVKNFAHGYLTLTEQDGWLCFYRYTDAQRAFYVPPRYTLGVNDTTGMRLECTTDATELSFDYDYHNGTRPYYCFDLYVNGELYSSVGKEWGWQDNYNDNGHLSFGLPAGTKRLTLWLPTIGYAKLKNVTLTDATVLEWTSYEKTYLAIGDSITHGSAAFHPSNSFPARLARAWGVELFNHGLGGDFYNEKNLGDGFPTRPDYITVLLGCNDWYNYSKERHEENCVAFYRRLNQLYPQNTIAVLTLLWNRDADQEKKMGGINVARDVIIREVEKYPNMVLIPGQELLPEDPDLLVDACHPSDKGYQVIVNNLKPRLEKIFGL